MNNRGLLIVIAVLLLGIFAVAIGNVGERDDSLSGSINEVTEEIGDEIDDATTD